MRLISGYLLEDRLETPKKSVNLSLMSPDKLRNCVLIKVCESSVLCECSSASGEHGQNGDLCGFSEAAELTRLTTFPSCAPSGRETAAHHHPILILSSQMRGTEDIQADFSVGKLASVRSQTSSNAGTYRGT